MTQLPKPGKVGKRRYVFSFCNPSYMLRTVLFDWDFYRQNGEESVRHLILGWWAGGGDKEWSWLFPLFMYSLFSFLLAKPYCVPGVVFRVEDTVMKKKKTKTMTAGLKTFIICCCVINHPQMTWCKSAPFCARSCVGQASGSDAGGRETVRFSSAPEWRGPHPGWTETVHYD